MILGFFSWNYTREMPFVSFSWSIIIPFDIPLWIRLLWGSRTRGFHRDNQQMKILHLSNIMVSVNNIITICFIINKNFWGRPFQPFDRCNDVINAKICILTVALMFSCSFRQHRFYISFRSLLSSIYPSGTKLFRLAPFFHHKLTVPPVWNLMTKYLFIKHYNKIITF